MKRILILGLVGAMLLCGCNTPAYETVGDVYITQPPAEGMTVGLELPEAGAEAVMEGSGGGRSYLYDGYEEVVQTLSVASLDEALRSVTGFGKDRLMVMATREGELDRYDCVWCTAGEQGDRVGRAAIFHDGSHFYCVSALADSTQVHQLSPVWNQILDSISLS